MEFGSAGNGHTLDELRYTSERCLVSDDTIWSRKDIVVKGSKLSRETGMRIESDFLKHSIDLCQHTFSRRALHR